MSCKFQTYRKPKFGMKILQILQGQFTGFDFLISFLNRAREFFVLISVGICSHILYPKYDADSLPL